MTNRANGVRGGVVVVLLALGWACGGGKPITEGGKAESELKGRVIKAPVALASVVAYRASPTLERGEVLAQAKADEQGDFVLALPHYQGHVLLVATSGSYLEEAIGLGVQLGENELSMLLPDFTTGKKLEGLRLTPVSTLAVALARYHVGQGQAAGAAYSEALVHLHQHFGGVDWASVTPADLTAPGATNLSPESRAGLVLGGLSWLAKLQAEASDVTPGLVVNAATLTSALAQDAVDGTFDGLSSGVTVKQAKASLSGLTLRTELVQGITGFVNSPRNASALKLQDITAFLAAIGTNADPYLFCPGGVAAPSCGAGPVDTEPPVLSFLRPNAGAGVAGSTQVEVQASDNVKLRSLKFTAPASLVSAAPVFTGEGRQGSLLATLDVSALPDGPVEIRAEAVDESGNPAAKSVSVTVSNQGPRLSISSPADGATVRGASVQLTASAQAQAPGASIARIEVVGALPGLGADALPAADAFTATWNTTMAPEGATPITLRAVDSFGTATEVTITVTVDNVPLGQVTAYVLAGAPVDGLTVKMLAIDDTTGLPVQGRMGGPVLGQSTGVTVDGGVSFELSQENWNGPVQLVAQGPSATYVDPSDGTSLITLPSSFAFTSYVDSYRTGDRLERPVSYWTTLADVAARAFAVGRNPTHPTPGPLTSSLAAVDPLFAKHVTSAAWATRTTVPVSLTRSSQSLRDVVYAALPDVALNQESRDLALQVGLTPGTGFGAPQLVSLLAQDLEDGQFDGKSLGVQLSTAGTSPAALDANTTRFYQAIALDRFVRGTQNRTQLTRQDLQTSNIYDTMSMDTSLLYPGNQQPIPFDNLPPNVTWTVTFAKDATHTVAPYGAARVVRGAVSLDLTATDFSQVASITVTAGSTQVPAAQGSTASHFIGSFDVSALADGPFTFSVEACDRLANCGTTTYAVTVDNTAPSVSVAKPTTGGFFSRAFDVEATATDPTGVESLLASAANVTLVDVDPAPERVSVLNTQWSATQSAGWMPFSAGQQSVGFQACDYVGNCTSATRSVVVDQQPPSVAVTSVVPTYTNQATVTLSGSVQDLAGPSLAGAGVARVLVSNNGRAPLAATITGNAWSVVVSLDDTINALRVWGEDLAAPANVGSSSSAPFLWNVSIVRDPDAPMVQTRSVASYRDERNLGVVKDANGRPVMPPQYQYAAAPVAVDEGGTIYKIKSKTGAADDNVPFLRWAVINPPAGTAPLTQPTYMVTMLNGSVACPLGGCASGNLRLSSTTEAGYALYELPLVPAQLALPNGGTARVVVSFPDQAGNVATRSFSISVVLVGAPVVAVLDTNYASYGDTSSIYPYTTNSNYPALIGSQRRVLRYVVYNPNAEVVWTSLAHSGFAGSWSERWNEGGGYSTGGTYPSDLGTTQFDYVDWYSRVFNGNWEATDSECGYYPSACPSGDASCTTCTPGVGGCVDRRQPFPCGRSTETNPNWWVDPRPVHYFGEAAPFTRCETPHTGGTTSTTVSGSAYPALTNNLSLTPSLNVMANPLATGKETTAAPSVNFGGNSGWSIPAATAGTASAIAVYVVVATPARPASGVAAAVYPLSGTGQQRFRAGWHYRWSNINTKYACKVCRGFACITYAADYYNQGWTAEYFDRYLMDHTVSISGALTLRTNPDFVSTSATLSSSWPNVPYSYNATR